MAEKKNESNGTAKNSTNETVTEHKAPTGSSKTISWKSLKVKADANWIVLRKKEKPAAEIFYTSYRVAGKKKRPLTFVFNGGPGAASAFLHLGAMGPERVYFESNGEIAPPPVKLVTNNESWIDFTDLVFIDPVGTGFSRILVPEAKLEGDKKDAGKAVDEKEYYQLSKDLDSICEFIERYLSENQAWDAPIYIAGESYGGYRTAKLARRLQAVTGVELSGAVIISPAMEWWMLSDGDYQVLRSVDNFCSMALAAVHHGRSRIFKKGAVIEKIRLQIEAFATRELAHALLVGTAHDEHELSAVFQKTADYLGLPYETVQVAEGRIPFWRFCRELLKDEKKVLGFYDASITAHDPFPDRETHQAPDPTLVSDHRTFTTAINHMLRTKIGIKTDRRYELLNEEVNRTWKRDEQVHVFDTEVGATDDLRYAMSMNPFMKVLFTHGYYDLVTPYFTSERIVNQMKLPSELKKNLEIQHFVGGHMFYTWDHSRKAFHDWVKSWYV